MKNMQRMILAFLLLLAIVSILMMTRQSKAAERDAIQDRFLSSSARGINAPVCAPGSSVPEPHCVIATQP